MVTTFLQRIHRSPFDRRQRENKVIFTNATIMNHTTEGSLVPSFLDFASGSVNGPYHNIVRSIMSVSARLISEADHLARVRVEFRMCSESRRQDLPFKVIPSNSLECHWVHDEGRTILLRSQQYTSPESDVGVCRGANDSLHGLVVRVGVAVSSKQGFASRSFGLVSFRPHVPLLEVRVAVLDSNRRHAPVAIEVDVVFEYGREPVVRLDAVECPVDLGRDQSVDFEVDDVAFKSGWEVEARKDACLRKFGLVGGLFAVDVVGTRGNLRREVVDVCHLGSLLSLFLGFWGAVRLLLGIGFQFFRKHNLFVQAQCNRRTEM